ncbi:MAG: glycosyltransferase family 4 protein [Acidobacteriota bacterium]
MHGFSPAATERPLAVFWTHDLDAPSTHHRLMPILRALGHGGWRVHIDRLPEGRPFRRIVERRETLGDASLLILGQITLSPGEGWLLRALGRRVLLDLDHAVHLGQDETPIGGMLRRRVQRLAFRHTCAIADHIVVSNPALAEAVPADPSRVRVLPTAVSVPPYRALAEIRRQPRTLVWSGRSDDLHALETLRPVLAELARTYPDLVLRVVGERAPDWPEVRIEHVADPAAQDIATLAAAGIGLLPRSDDPWSRRRPGVELLRLMAAGLPTVASPVGIHQDILDHGVNGYLASDPRDWTTALRRLLDDPEHALTVGRAGRARVGQDFARARYVSRTLDVISALLLDESPRESTWTSSRPMIHPAPWASESPILASR